MLIVLAFAVTVLYSHLVRNMIIALSVGWEHLCQYCVIVSHPDPEFWFRTQYKSLTEVYQKNIKTRYLETLKMF